MNQHNLEDLKDKLGKAGFGDFFNGELEKNINRGFSMFILQQQTEYGGGKMQYDLHFEKVSPEEKIQFTKFEARLEKPDGRELAHTFFVGGDGAFNKTESYNLLDGRAVSKEYEQSQGGKQEEWVMLDFSRAADAGNFSLKTFSGGKEYDLEKIIANYPVTEQKEMLVQLLRQGNLEQVSWGEPGNEIKRYMAADPENKTVKIFDHTLEEIKIDTKDNQLKVSVEPLVKQRVSTGKGLKL
jgi:hypothetical protein